LHAGFDWLIGTVFKSVFDLFINFVFPYFFSSCFNFDVFAQDMLALIWAASVSSFNLCPFFLFV